MDFTLLSSSRTPNSKFRFFDEQVSVDIELAIIHVPSNGLPCVPLSLERLLKVNHQLGIVFPDLRIHPLVFLIFLVRQHDYPLICPMASSRPVAPSTPLPPFSFDKPRFGRSNILALTGLYRVSAPMPLSAKIQACAAKALA